jgi:hypothetical protein
MSIHNLVGVIQVDFGCNSNDSTVQADQINIIPVIPQDQPNENYLRKQPFSSSLLLSI